MSPDNAPPDRTSDTEPLWYVTLQDYPEITVIAFNYMEDRCHIEYSGWPEDLIAAGVMQAPWATPTGKHLRDPDGGKVSISRQWRLAGQPTPRRYCVVRREDRPRTELARWPGASAAAKAHEKHAAWDQARRLWAYSSAPTAAAQPRPVLRLVVDNTRPKAGS